MTTSSGGSTSPPSTSNTSSTNTTNNNAAPKPTTPTMNTDYTKTVNVKKVPFDATEAYNCAHALWEPLLLPQPQLFSVMQIVMNISCYKVEELTALP
jgi:hypothetical protein